MATLTWRDVAGQVRAPDYSEAASLITQGISGLGNSVRDLGTAPEKRRLEGLAKQAAVIQMEQQGQRELAQTANQLGTVLKTERKEKDMEAFGSIQSLLEAGSREAAIKGVSLDDFLKSNDAYLKLPKGAQALGAAHLSDAYGQGLTIREQQADNARQERQFMMNYQRQAEQFNRSYGLQAAGHAQSVKESNARIEALTKAEQKAREAAGLLSDDPETNLALRERRAQVGQQIAPLMRGMELYGKLSPQEAAKKGGMDTNWFKKASDEAQAVAREVERSTGKKVDSWMINQLLVEGGGADNWRTNPAGGLDNSMAADYLQTLAELQDAAVYNQQSLDRMEESIRGGKKYSADILQGVPIRTGISAPAKKPAGPTFKVPRAGRE